MLQLTKTLIKSELNNFNQKLLQEKLNNLKKYSNTARFKISKSKAQAIIFSKNRNQDENLVLKLGNDTINIVKEIKILEMIFDKKLNWKSHSENLKQCSSRLNLLKVLAVKNWGSSQKNIINTYKALIQSKLDYGCIIYSSTSKHILSKLDPILNAAARIATGVSVYAGSVTSPINSILSESELMPLDLRRNKLTMNYTTRLFTTPKNQAHSLLSRTMNSTDSSTIEPFYRRTIKLLKELNIDSTQIKTITPYNSHYWITIPKIQTTIITNLEEIQKTIEHYSLCAFGWRE